MANTFLHGGIKAVLTGALAAASCAAMPAAAAKPDWPSKPISLIVPFAAGGPTDVAARAIGQSLSVSLGTPVIVENRPGANGFIGAGDLIRSKPDGYTLMISSLAMAINPYLYDKVPYDPNKDFVPLSMVLTVPMMAVINPKVLPVNTLPELVAYLKAHPNAVSYGSAGNGGSSHLIAEYFKSRTGTTMTHIPYKGSSPAVTDLVAGNIGIIFDTLVTSAPFLKAGKLRMLAVTSDKRLEQFPDTPTMSEALGIENFSASSWYGMYAPAGTPADIVQRLSDEINANLKQPDLIKRLHGLGAIPAGSSPAELAQFQRAEQEKWREVIQGAHIKPD